MSFFPQSKTNCEVNRISALLHAMLVNKNPFLGSKKWQKSTITVSLKSKLLGRFRSCTVAFCDEKTISRVLFEMHRCRVEIICDVFTFKVLCCPFSSLAVIFLFVGKSLTQTFYLTSLFAFHTRLNWIKGD